MTEPRLSLVIPAWNEAGRLLRARSSIQEFVALGHGDVEVVLCDDGSEDDTVAIASQLAAEISELRVIEIPHSGKGAALNVGLSAALGRTVVFTDVDFAAAPAELYRLAVIAERSKELVIGSRATPGANLRARQSHLREGLGKLFNLFVRLLVLPGVRDTQCGAKAAEMEIWRRVVPEAREVGYAWDVEVLAIATSKGIRIREVGVEWSHEADSRVRVLRDGLQMGRALLRIRRRI